VNRQEDLDQFYVLLEQLRQKLGGHRRLSDCSGRSGWAKSGVYFFFEDGEVRENGRDLRVVRVGTHGLTTTSRSSLWSRLAAHRGNVGGARPGGGSHRGSVFRKHVGYALKERQLHPEGVWKQWGKGSSAPREVMATEHSLERDVSRVIGAMPLLWLEVDDAPGPGSLRALIERNAIALLSNFRRPPIDEASADWLGHLAVSSEVRESGLWNVDFVERTHERDFLTVMGRLVAGRVVC
jgi:hypothetical protein